LPSGKKVISSGLYKDTAINKVGCDSITTANITINNLDTSVTRFGNRFISTVTDGSYQWVKCDNNFQPLDGETKFEFTPLYDGSYAVIILKNNCIDTSSCFTTVGLMENELLANISIAPNPTKEMVNLTFHKSFENLTIQVLTAEGREVSNIDYQNTEFVGVHLIGKSGIYLLKITTKVGETATLKVMKE
jgi:hypothetical protein